MSKYRRSEIIFTVYEIWEWDGMGLVSGNAITDLPWPSSGLKLPHPQLLPCKKICYCSTGSLPRPGYFLVKLQLVLRTFSECALASFPAPIRLPFLLPSRASLSLCFFYEN